MILITGAAGFIGFHLAKKLLDKKLKVIGVDSYDNYYDVSLKKKRIEILKKNKKNFIFYKVDISNEKKINKVFNSNKIKFVIIVIKLVYV